MNGSAEPKRQQGRVTGPLALSTIASCVGSSLEFGYNIGVIPGSTEFAQDFINETYYERSGLLISESNFDWLWSTVVSIYCVGGAMGAFIAGFWADFFGRKGGLLYNNVFSIIGSVLMGCCQAADSPELLIIGRFVIGISCGLSLAIVPMYLAEIAPVNLRGSITMNNGLCIAIGILLAQILGFYVFHDAVLWPTAYGLSAATAVIELILLPFCPESPRWLLIKRGDENGATQALRRFRGADYDIDVELNEMKKEQNNAIGSEKVGICDILCLRDRAWKRPLIICLVLHSGMQFAGINVLTFYSSQIYAAAGMNDEQMGYATMGFGSVYVLTALVAVWLVESSGRKTLLLYPYILLTICSAGLTTSLALQEDYEWMTWLSLTFVYLSIFAFGIGPVAVPHVVTAEVWCQGPRTAAVSIAVQANWWSNFIVQMCFLPLTAVINEYVFLICMGSSLLTALFVFFFLPETKNRSFEEIVARFRTPPDANANELADGICMDAEVYDNKGQILDDNGITLSDTITSRQL